MAKDNKARVMGTLTISAIGVVMASAVDAMRYANVPNDIVHVFLDQLEDGFDALLDGEAQIVMLGLVHVLRKGTACND